MGTVTIKYYNVLFRLRIETERDLFVFTPIKERIIKGEDFVMKDIVQWCKGHGIAYSYQFTYRRDFPVLANLWNSYSYLRFKFEQIKEEWKK